MINSRIFVLLLFLMACLAGVAQETRTVEGEYTYYGDDNTTPKEARSRALEGARPAALAKEFGTTVTQSVVSDESPEKRGGGQLLQIFERNRGQRRVDKRYRGAGV